MKITAKKIELTRELKVTLLEAVKSGSLDLSIFYEEEYEQEMSIDEIIREIVRLEQATYDRKYLIALSELMRKFADGDISY